MAQTNLGRLLRSKVLERINEYAASIAEGSAKDYPAYRQSVGMVQGMRETMNVLEDLEKEQE